MRDIIGRNPLFITQSGTFPHRFSDYSHEDARELADSNADWYNQGLKEDLDIPVTEQSKTMWSLLGSLGSHDLSVMREALGMPKSVLGCSIDAETPFWKYVYLLTGSLNGLLTGRQCSVSVPGLRLQLRVWHKRGPSLRCASGGLQQDEADHCAV